MAHYRSLFYRSVGGKPRKKPTGACIMFSDRRSLSQRAYLGLGWDSYAAGIFGFIHTQAVKIPYLPLYDPELIVFWRQRTEAIEGALG